MDPDAILALYDQEMRQHPPVDPGDVIERVGTIVRVVGASPWIAYSRLGSEEAEAAVETEVARFRGTALPLEWKLYGHDGPPNLPRVLEARGFIPDLPETLMTLDLREPFVPGPVSPAVEVSRVADLAMLEEAVRVSAAAFAPGPGWELEPYATRLGTRGFEVFVASLQGRIVSAGRLELPQGKSFASLWGGGTAPEFRGAGIYRALVAARADRARKDGYRYLTVDARETSRPILERIGFRALAPVVGWVLAPERNR